jgi:HEAT repeat protein
MLAERRNITERDRPNRGDARWVLVSLCATVEDAVIPLAEALPDLHAEDRESILREIGENARAYSAPVQEALTRAAMKFTGDRKGRLLVAPLLFQTKCHVPEIVAALLDDAMTDGPDGHEAYSSIALALCNYSDEASAVAHALQNAGPKAQLVVNGLMQQITNDTRVHKVAADAPGDGAPEDVLSAHFRSVGVKALGRLGPLAKPAVRFLSVLSITDPVEDVRKAATEALKSIEADAK